MKKLFTSLLSLLLFMPVSTVYAAGSDEIKAFPDSKDTVAILYSNDSQKDTTVKDVKQGDIITYTYAFGNLSGITTVLANCTYDNEAFEFDKATYSDAANQEGLNKVDTNDASATDPKQSVVSEGFTVTDNSVNVKGGFCKISFKAKKDGKVDDTSFTFSVKASAGDKEVNLQQYDFNADDYLKATGLTDTLESSEISLVEDKNNNGNSTDSKKEDTSKKDDANSKTTAIDKGIHININDNSDRSSDKKNADVASSTVGGSIQGGDGGVPGKGDWQAQKTSDNTFQMLIGAISGMLIFTVILAIVGVKNKDKISKLLKFRHHSL